MPQSSGAMGGRRRLAWYSITLMCIVAALFAGWFGARQFRSPAQREAEAKPPIAGPIYAVIRLGDLVDQVSGTGTLTYSNTSAVVPNELPPNAVVTREPTRRGATVHAGDVISEVNGSPVILFAGSFMFYRDMLPGMSGPDVRQLQLGLRAAGYAVPSSELGRFGGGTAVDVRALFHRDGYAAPVGFPLADVAVAPSLPGVLMSSVAVGSHPGGSSSIAKIGRGVVLASVSLASSAVVRTALGMKAMVTVSSTSTQYTATVSKVADGSGGQSTIELTPNTPLPSSIVGQIAVGIVTIHVVATHSLLVPARSVVTNADGSSEIMVRRSPRAATRVRVLGALGGVDAIAPIQRGGIHGGDMVQVG